MPSPLLEQERSTSPHYLRSEPGVEAAGNSSYEKHRGANIATEKMRVPVYESFRFSTKEESMSEDITTEDSPVSMTEEETQQWVQEGYELQIAQNRAKYAEILSMLLPEIRRSVTDAAEVLIFPSGAAYCHEDLVGAVWLTGWITGIDVHLTVGRVVPDDAVRVEPTGWMGLRDDITVVGCARASDLLAGPPTTPDAEAFVTASRSQLGKALRGNPDALIKIEITSGSMLVGSDRVPLLGNVETCDVTGQAIRRHVQAAMTSGRGREVTIGIRGTQRAGFELSTEVSQSIAGCKCSVHRCVVLRPV